jgi:hypothetical protein
MREHLSFAALTMQKRSVLAELGVIDLPRYRELLDAFLSGRLDQLDQASAMSYTLQAELWLRAREGMRDGIDVVPAPARTNTPQAGWAGADAPADPTFPVVRTV